MLAAAVVVLACVCVKQANHKGTETVVQETAVVQETVEPTPPKVSKAKCKTGIKLVAHQPEKKGLSLALPFNLADHGLVPGFTPEEVAEFNTRLCERRERTR